MQTILHVGPIDFAMPGGLNGAILGSVEAQQRYSDNECKLLVTQHGESGIVPASDAVEVFRYKSRRSFSELLDGGLNPDFVVFHNTYTVDHVPIAAECRKRQIPYIMTPHGGFTQIAQRIKWWKKIPANATVFSKLFREAEGIHFLTEGELANSLTWGLPSFVSPNGIGSVDASQRAFSSPMERRRLTYVGRITIFIKGLDLLIEAVDSIQDELRRNEVVLDIYGRAPGDDSDRLLRLINHQGIQDIVFVHDRIDETERDNVLRDSTTFMMVSRSEGHPMAAIEAMAAGVPCIVSEGSQLAEKVHRYGAGWTGADSAEMIAKRILQAITCNYEELRSMSLGAVDLADSEYGWQQVVQRTLDGYQLLLNHTTTPGGSSGDSSDA